jgi:GTP-binding protein
MKNTNDIPTICIVGRPNVGKSSLFNRLIGSRRAVVVEQSGTTRDRFEVVAPIKNFTFKVVDTGGYISEDSDALSGQVKEQIYEAMEEAELLVMVVDTIAGISPADEQVAAILRKVSKPVLVVANKTDNIKLEDDAAEFFRLGFGEPISVSCAHGRGMRRIRDKIVGQFENLKEHEEGKKYLKIAIVGRPNVGKSSYVNNILNRKRVIVSDVPGTTRDSIDTHFRFQDEDYILIDTAGIRHRRKVREAVDVYSIMRSKESIKRADVAVLIVDAADGMTRDDTAILKFIEENGKACLVLVNKWDLAADIQDVTVDDYKKQLIESMNLLSQFPIAFISCVTGKNVIDTLSMAKVLNANLDLHVSTPFLNKIFEKNNPSLVAIPRSKKRPNFLYITQTRKRPVEFTFFLSEPHNVLQGHMSFIENLLRENLPLTGIPIKVRLRKSRKEREQ